MSDYKSASQAVFVSSTFRDMQSERDMLRDYVLPRVNEFASAYGNTIELIDLRWGIDTDGISEAEQNNKVLRSCLEEIRRSRPFFIGLLGDRYGWIPPEKDMSAALALENYKTDDLNKSVTALEIEYGSLKAEFPPVSLFYFREMDLSRLDEKALGIYRDGDETARKRHQSLKALIKKTYPGLVKTYKAETKDGYVSGLNEFAEMAAKDIINALREKWGEPPAAPPWNTTGSLKPRPPSGKGTCKLMPTAKRMELIM